MPFALPAYYGAATSAPAVGLTTAARFGGTTSDYLERVFPSGGSLTVWTASWWIKQLAIGALRTDFSADGGTGVTSDYIYLDASNVRMYAFRDGLDLFTGLTNADTASWWNYVLQCNGTSFTAWRNNASDASGTKGATGNINGNITHTIGVRHRAGSLDQPFQCIIADHIFVDNQALTPSSFGYDNAGTWSWKEYSGTFTGNTDSRLKFDNSGNLGENSQGTDWTVNGNVTQETSDLPPQ